MPTIGDLIRDTKLAKAMFGARYGEKDPYLEAVKNARQLGYPVPGSTADQGQAQRYESSKLAAERYGALPLITNPLHEALLSWVSEGEGSPSLDRLMAGYRGTFDALEAPQQAQPQVAEGYGLQGAQIQPAEPTGSGTGIAALLYGLMNRGK